MKIKIPVVLSTLLITLSTLSCVQEKQMPNIILFYVDDMGWQDCSLPFHSEQTRLNRIYHTPNMEALAKEGMQFTQAYACAVCSPSRISLMTGMNGGQAPGHQLDPPKESVPRSATQGDHSSPVEHEWDDPDPIWVSIILAPNGGMQTVSGMCPDWISITGRIYF